jgi:hypothetical protein
LDVLKVIEAVCVVDELRSSKHKALLVDDAM